MYQVAHAEDLGVVRQLLRDIATQGTRPLILVGAAEPAGDVRRIAFAVAGGLSPAAAAQLLRAAAERCDQLAAGQVGGAVELVPRASN